MNDRDLIKSVLTEVLAILNFSTEIECKQEEETLIINVKTPEASFLIGPKGENLFALQYLLKLIVNKKSDNADNLFILDVNDYRSNRTKLLRELAANIADEACLERRDKELQPMSSFERRVIHVALAERGNVSTESVGFGELRRVVIKPV